jgi:uncharacterized paraquat-inducible protein A
MYCQACGNEQPAELSYCNRCGARFGSGKELQVRSSAKLTTTVVALSASMTVITLVGFISVIASAMSLLERDLRMPDGFVFLLFFVLVVVLGVDILLARQISRLLNSGSRYAEFVPPVPAPLMSGRSAPQLGEMKQPAMSVTENTTRFFEPSWESRDTQSKL